ncbi:MAG: hypothetical protein GEU92_03880 [Alphaproteobacteria bacterium]|nr:hypothetical protein [Alphaproteobacteria bacterium]
MWGQQGEKEWEAPAELRNTAVFPSSVLSIAPSPFASSERRRRASRSSMPLTQCCATCAFRRTNRAVAAERRRSGS